MRPKASRRVPVTGLIAPVEQVGPTNVEKVAFTQYPVTCSHVSLYGTAAVRTRDLWPATNAWRRRPPAAARTGPSRGGRCPAPPRGARSRRCPGEQAGRGDVGIDGLAGRVRHPLRLEVRVARAVDQREPLGDGGAGLEPLLAHGAPEAVVVVVLPDRDVRVRARDGARLRGARPIGRGGRRRVVADACLQLRGGRRRNLRDPPEGVVGVGRREARGVARRGHPARGGIARLVAEKEGRGRGRSVDPAGGQRLAVLERAGPCRTCRRRTRRSGSSDGCWSSRCAPGASSTRRSS